MARPVKTEKEPDYKHFIPASAIDGPVDESGVTIAELMEESAAWQEQIDIATKRRAEIAVDLARIAQTFPEVVATGGILHGSLALYYNGLTSRKTLNIGLLAERMAEYGAPASLIEECKLPGKEYVDMKLVDISKPKKNNKGEE